jgi:hypothetical protein
MLARTAHIRERPRVDAHLRDKPARRPSPGRDAISGPGRGQISDPNLMTAVSVAVELGQILELRQLAEELIPLSQLAT